MKIRSILLVSITLNLIVAIFGTIYINEKGGFAWISSKLFHIEEGVIPSLPLPGVDDRILLIGDSHLAIHPWAEYSALPFSNRAVSGSRIVDIDIDRIDGIPRVVVVSTCTNDFQAKKPLTTDEVKTALSELLAKISAKWPKSIVVYVSPPHPNVKIYEVFIRKKYPHINRPKAEDIDSVRRHLELAGILTLQAKSADVDGLHIDPESARTIAKDIEGICVNQSALFNEKE